LRVFCISLSNSPSIICPRLITFSLQEIAIQGGVIVDERKANVNMTSSRASRVSSRPRPTTQRNIC